jgi:predicted rRNA methylase YqxC with S4 and FtsJ domains
LSVEKKIRFIALGEGYFDSRQKAIAVIMSGDVYIDNQKADKLGKWWTSRKN